MKRRSRRSTSWSTSSLIVPATWLRKPSSRYCGTNSIPDLPSRNAQVTSPALLPIDETTPRPVTTTRRMSACRRRRRRRLEQPDLEIIGLVDRLAVGQQDAVGDPHHELAEDHALGMEVVRHL